MIHPPRSHVTKAPGGSLQCCRLLCSQLSFQQTRRHWTRLCWLKPIWASIDVWGQILRDLTGVVEETRCRELQVGGVGELGVIEHCTILQCKCFRQKLWRWGCRSRWGHLRCRLWNLSFGGRVRTPTQDQSLRWARRIVQLVMRFRQLRLVCKERHPCEYFIRHRPIVRGLFGTSRTAVGSLRSITWGGSSANLCRRPPSFVAVLSGDFRVCLLGSFCYLL